VSGLKTSSQQLVFSLRAKAWSTFTMRNMTSATQYTSTLPFVVLGDSSGFLYKHNYTQGVAKTDFSDAGFSIDGYYQSKYQKYPFLLELQNLTIKEQKYLFDNNNTKVGLVGDNGTSVSEIINSTNTVYGNEDTYLVATDAIYDSWVITFGESNTYVAYVAVGDTTAYKLKIKLKTGGIWNNHATLDIASKKFAISEISGRIYVAVDGVIYKANSGSSTFSKLTNAGSVDLSYTSMTTTSERFKGFVFMNWNGFPILCTSSTDTYYVYVLSNADYSSSTNWVQTALVTYQKAAGDNLVDVVWHNNNTNIYVMYTRTATNPLLVDVITPNSKVTSPTTATRADYADSSSACSDFGAAAFVPKLRSGSFVTLGTDVYFVISPTFPDNDYSFVFKNGVLLAEIDPGFINGQNALQAGRVCELFTDGSNILALTDFFQGTNGVYTSLTPIHQYIGTGVMSMLSKDSGVIIDEVNTFVYQNHGVFGDIGTINGVPFIVAREKIGTDFVNAQYTTQPKNIVYATFAGSGFQKTTPGYKEECIHARMDTQSFSFFVQNNTVDETFSLVGYFVDYFPTTNRKGP